MMVADLCNYSLALSCRAAMNVGGAVADGAAGSLTGGPSTWITAGANFKSDIHAHMTYSCMQDVCRDTGTEGWREAQPGCRNGAHRASAPCPLTSKNPALDTVRAPGQNRTQPPPNSTQKPRAGELSPEPGVEQITSPGLWQKSMSETLQFHKHPPRSPQFTVHFGFMLLPRAFANPRRLCKS